MTHQRTVEQANAGKGRCLGVALTLFAAMLVPAGSLRAQSDAVDAGLIGGEPMVDLQDGTQEALVLFTPYVFIPMKVKGSTTVADATVNLDLGIDDILDHFDVIGVSGLLEMRQGREEGTWGLYFAAFYLDLDSDQFFLDTPFPGANKLGVSVDIEQTQIDLGVSYRPWVIPIGDAEHVFQRHLDIDVSYGARYINLKQVVTVSTVAGGMDLGGTEDWVDMAIGVRAKLYANEKWNLSLASSASGFGIGSGSDLMINAIFGVQYQPNPRTRIRFEYQYYSIDYTGREDDGEFGIDLEMHGPWIGMGIMF